MEPPHTPTALLGMWLLVCGSVLAAPAEVATAAAPAPAGAAGDAWALTLAGALPGDRPLQVRLALRDGAVRAAFALAPTFNRMPHDVDAGGLKHTGDGLAGTIKVTIHSDGYNPKDVAKVDCVFDLKVTLAEDKARGSFTGRYGAAEVKGEVTGLAVAAPASAALHMNLDCENAVRLAKTDKPHNRRARISFGLRDGKAFAGKLDPPGSITDTSMAALVTSTDLTLVEGVLAGTLKATIRPQGGGEHAFAWTLAGVVIGDVGAGTIGVVRDSAALEAGRFIARLAPADAVKADDCVYQLTLHEVMSPGGYLKLFLSCRSGVFTAGFGSTPNFNNATHDVDVSGLKLEAGKLTGALKVTVQPDPWVPADHQPVACDLTVDAEIQDGEVVGRYEGSAGGRAVKSRLDGELTARLALDKPARGMIKYENGLSGGSDYHNRAFCSFDLAGDDMTGGKVGNNHTRLTGTVQSGRITRDGDRFTATMKVKIEPGGGVTPGIYTFNSKGVCIGAWLSGGFEAFFEDKPTKTGRLWGNLVAAPPTGK